MPRPRNLDLDILENFNRFGFGNDFRLDSGAREQQIHHNPALRFSRRAKSHGSDSSAAILLDDCLGLVASCDQLGDQRFGFAIAFDGDCNIDIAS